MDGGPRFGVRGWWKTKTPGDEGPGRNCNLSDIISIDSSPGQPGCVWPDAGEDVRAGFELSRGRLLPERP